MTQSAQAAMLAGVPYQGNDPALVALRYRAKGLLRRLDRVEPEDMAGRRAVIQALFGSVRRISSAVVRACAHCLARP